MKQIKDLSIEELGHLFPIALSEPNPEWVHLFTLEKAEIEEVIGPHNIVSLEHIGSTAIPNLKAKSSIDILLEVIDKADNEKMISGLTSLGYDYIPRPENPPPHMMFAKGYTMQGFRGQAFHVHVRYKGDWDEKYFRDYLIKHPEIASEYGKLKEELAEMHKNDREAYTEAKTEFIKQVNCLAGKNRITINKSNP